MIENEYSQEEIFAAPFESEKDKKRRQMLAVVTKSVDAHRLQKMRDLLTFEKLATWRRMNGFDRVVDGEDNWFHAHLLPPTPQEFSASLRSNLQELKNAISMPAETRPWQKTMDFVNALEQGKVSDEEFAILKWLVEKRSREAAQAQVTVSPVDTVQHCSPCPLEPEPSLDVCVKLESNEGRMDPERGELESSSAGTGLETPGQQYLPNGGTWDQGRTAADGFLTTGVGSNQGGSISSPTEWVDMRASTKSTATFADISSPTEHIGTRAGTAATPAKRRHETIISEQNKQFDPGGKGEKAPPWNAAVTLLSFSRESWEAPLLVLRIFGLCFVFALSSKLLFFSGDHFSTS